MSLLVVRVREEIGVKEAIQCFLTRACLLGEWI